MAYREVEKSLSTRVVELIRALQVLADSAKAVREGRLHQIIPLSGQVRALLTDRSTQAGPLLLEIARFLGQPIELFSMPEVTDPPLPGSLAEGLVLHVRGFPVTTHRQLPAQEAVHIEDFLDRRLLWYEGTRYSVRT